MTDMHEDLAAQIIRLEICVREAAQAKRELHDRNTALDACRMDIQAIIDRLNVESQQ